VKNSRVVFQAAMPLDAQNYDMKKDSLRFAFAITPAHSNFVLPLYIYQGNKSKSKIEFELHGKAISGHEYTVTYRRLEIRRDTTLIGRSTDPALFQEVAQRAFPKDGVSPLYGTKYLLELKSPRKARLWARIEFDVKNKAGHTETFVMERNLQKIEGNDVTLLNIFK
jgi:hypothetical protein